MTILQHLYSLPEGQALVSQIVEWKGLSLPLLRDETRLALLEELTSYSIVQQDPVYGPYNVHQSFSSVEHFRSGSLFHEVRRELEQALHEAFSEHDPYPLPEPPTFNDLTVQRYPKGEIGISPHRDQKYIRGTICVLVLEGWSRFCLCDDREGINPIPIRNEPGDMILLIAPGFLGQVKQPFHFVDQITEQRTSFALRIKQVETVQAENG